MPEGGGGIFFSEQGIRNASRIHKQMTLHDHDTGGAFVVITGGKGSGKTTALHHITQQSFTLEYRRGRRVFVPDMVLYRCRPEMMDTWPSLLDAKYPWSATSSDGRPLTREVAFFHHAGDFPLVKHEDEAALGGMEGRIHAYTDFPDLYRQLRPGGFNVILEPEHYTPGEDFLRRIEKKAYLTLPKKVFGAEMDSAVWWVEFIEWLLYHKGTEGIVVVMDEADEVFTSGAAGLRFHIQAYFGSLARDFRRRVITFLMVLHNWGDADHAVTRKANFYVWFRGRPPPAFSELKKYGPLIARLETGSCVFEHQGFGGNIWPVIPFTVRGKVVYGHRPELPQGEAAAVPLADVPGVPG